MTKPHLTSNRSLIIAGLAGMLLCAGIHNVAPALLKPTTQQTIRDLRRIVDALETASTAQAEPSPQSPATPEQAQQALAEARELLKILDDHPGQLEAFEPETAQE